MNMNNKDAWYHCGHCGSLFQSDYGHDEDRLCEGCQRKPGVGLWPVVSAISQVASSKVASFHKTGEKVKKFTRAPTPKKRRLRGLVWLTLVWVLVLLGVVGLRHYQTNSSDKPRALGVMDLDKRLAISERKKILNQVLPECDRVIRRFLSASEVGDRSELMFQSDQVKGMMEAYYKSQKFPEVDMDSLQRTGQDWVRLGREWMVITHWKDAIGENGFDAVFRKESDGWKLDWLHFSRYSETSWNSFLAGEGESDQAEFRLLARQHMDDKVLRLDEERMMIVLAESVWGKPKQIGSESHTILVDSMSEKGRLLAKAFELREKNLDSSKGEIAPLESDDFVRVRVKITRDELGGKYRLIINDLEACHWIDSDIPGF